MISYAQQRGGAIKSIQRGVAALNGVASLNVTISAVNTAYTELRMLGHTASFNEAGSGGLPVGGCSVRLSNATTIAAAVAGAGASANASISWELTEYYPT